MLCASTVRGGGIASRSNWFLPSAEHPLSASTETPRRVPSVARRRRLRGSGATNETSFVMHSRHVPTSRQTLLLGAGHDGGRPRQVPSTFRHVEPAPVYLDGASSEPLHPAAREALAAALGTVYADARRLHGPARNARLVLDNARAVVAECLGVRPDEVTFTPSGTHAVHLGLLGLLAGRRRGEGRTLVHSAVEHSAVLHAAAWSQAPTASVRVDATGRVDPRAVAEAALGVDGGAGVLAVQTANHEVGTVQPVAEVASAVPSAPLFTDACASLGRIPLPAGWSAAAGSAHKWGGPAGVGVLLVRKGARWRNPFPGDDRVDERTIGFENVPAALAAAAALQAVVSERDEVNARQGALVDRLRTGLASVADTDVVGDPVERLPHLVTASFLYVDGEAVVTELDRRGFSVASGSACTASTLEPSHVLAAMGALTHGNIRISLARDTTPDDVERLLQALPQVVDRIRREAGVGARRPPPRPTAPARAGPPGPAPPPRGPRPPPPPRGRPGR